MCAKHFRKHKHIYSSKTENRTKKISLTLKHTQKPLEFIIINPVTARYELDKNRKPIIPTIEFSF